MSAWRKPVKQPLDDSGWLQGGVGLSEEPYIDQAGRLQFFMAEATRRFSPAQKEQLIEIIRALLRGYEVPR